MDWRVQGTLSPTDFIVREYLHTRDVANSTALGWLDQVIRKARCEGRMAVRADVTPRAIGPRAMPTVVIVDVEEVPRHYRLRLVGTAMVRLTGRDNTGRTFEEMAEEHREAHAFFVSVLDRLVSRRRPLIFTGNLFYRDMEWVRYRCLACPLSQDGERVDRIVAAFEMLPGAA